MSYETNIVEIKKIYQEQLLNVLTPLIYEGFITIYNNAKNKYNKFIEDKETPPSILIIFQLFLKEIPNLSNNLIDKETERIRSHSNCADYFDNLIRAVVKSTIILLTYNHGKIMLNNEKFNSKVNINNFIHKCYIECARTFYDQPSLFWDEISSNEYKKNQILCYKLINKSITKTIQNILPMKNILDEYLMDKEQNKIINDKKVFSKIKTKTEQENANKTNDELKDLIYERKFEEKPVKNIIMNKTPNSKTIDILINTDHYKKEDVINNTIPDNNDTENYYDENV